MSKYYDRVGQSIDMMTWARMLEDRNTQRVAETTLTNGKWVSTVWLGLDHQFGDGPPLIFETMVFPRHGDFAGIDSDRYSTEAEALAGHERMVAKYGP